MWDSLILFWFCQVYNHKNVILINGLLKFKQYNDTRIFIVIFGLVVNDRAVLSLPAANCKSLIFLSGAALALYCALHYEKPLAACIALSTFFPETRLPEPEKLFNKGAQELYFFLHLGQGWTWCQISRISGPYVRSDTGYLAKPDITTDIRLNFWPIYLQVLKICFHYLSIDLELCRTSIMQMLYNRKINATFFIVYRFSSTNCNDWKDKGIM